MPRALPRPRSSGHIDLPEAGTEETFVYRAYCRCGDLLYVGMTYNLFSRLTGHARTRAPWERKAVRLEWDLYRNRAAAEVVERRLIRDLRPVYNRHGAMPPRGRPVPLPWPTWPEPGETPDERRMNRIREKIDALPWNRI